MTQVVAWIGSLILGIGAVWKIVNRYSPKIRRAIVITNETLDIARHILDSWEDKKITKQEIETLLKEVEDLQKVLEDK